MKRLLVLAMGLLVLVINACSDPDASFSDSIIPPVSPEDTAAYGRLEESVAIRIGLHIPATDSNPVIPYIEKLTNVRIIHPWEAEGEDAYRQKIDLAIASRDLPDAMVVDRSQLRKLIERGMIQNLTEVYHTYASSLVKGIYDSTNGQALKDASSGGLLYGLPNVAIEADSPTLLWVRQDWLDRLKLQPPRTLDDVERIAQAFMAADLDGDGKNNTIGIPGYKQIVYGQKPGLGGFDSVFNSYGAYPKSWILDAAGEAVYGSITPQNKQALAKLADWYRNGVIDKQLMPDKLIQEPIGTNKTGMFFAPWWVPFWPLSKSVQEDAEAEWRPYPVPLQNDGSFTVQMAPVTDRYLVVRRGYPYPEAAVKILNVMTRLERKLDPDVKEVRKLDDSAAGVGTLLRNFYPFDLLLDYSDGVERRYKSIQAVLAGSKTAASLDGEARTLYELFLQEREQPKKNMDAWMASLSYESGLQVMLKTAITQSRGVFYGATPAMETHWSSLERLENETFQKIIIGDLPVDAFDAFVSQWKDSGGSTITDEVNAALAAE